MGLLLKQLEYNVRKLVNPKFKFKKGIGGFMFKENLIGKSFNIHVSLSGYPDMYKISPASVNIEFENVENIIRDALIAINGNAYIAGRTIQCVCINLSNVNYKVFDKIMYDESDFEEFGIELKKTIEQGAYPFFEMYDSLEKVFDETEKMDLKEVMKIICQPLPQRRLILKGLHNYKSYLEYYEKMIEVYSKSGKPNDLPLIYKIKELVDVKMGY